jgi:Fe-S oxidoreductase
LFQLSPAEKIAFVVLAAVLGGLALEYARRVVAAVRRGRPDPDPRTDDLSGRLARAVWLAVSQTRVFRARPVVSALHSLIFFGFTYYLLVNLVDAAEGLLGVDVRSSTPLGAAYTLAADLLTLGILVGVIGLWLRRFLTTLGVRTFRFNDRTPLHEAVRGGKVPTDSAIVTAFITFHVGMRLFSQGFRILQTGPDPFQPVATAVAAFLAANGPSDAAVEFGRHLTWWGALGSILVFLPYFARSKHIHIFAAPAKYAVERRPGTGTLPAMELEAERFGAERLEDLSWPRLLDAYACIQCNRCQDACPASQTGKALSPAALEINKRMELNSLTTAGPIGLVPTGFVTGDAPSPRPLLEFAINEEAVWACTTCGACMEVCPVADEQMLDIVDIRRERVLMAGEFPRQLQAAFTGMERQGNPWNLSADKRLEWAEGLDVPTVEANPNPDVLYWVGCAAAYDPGAQRTARAFVTLLREAGVNFAVLGKREACTGDSARRAGNEYLYADLADRNIATLQGVAPKLVVATCPHCMNALANEYPQRGGHFEVVHHTTYLERLVHESRLDALPVSEGAVTYHDPCYLGRHNGVYDAPRELIRGMGLELLELERSREKSFCCGAGGAQFWKEEEPGAERVSDNRFREVKARLREGEGHTVAVGCPFCKSMLASTPEAQDAGVAVKDVAELMLENQLEGRSRVGSTHRAGSGAPAGD